ncbi:MAG: signal peptidase I [Mariprofundales bacterium]
MTDSIVQTTEQKKEVQQENQKPIWREWLESLIVIGLLAITIRSFIISPFNIPSSSMIPTLEIGDYIFVTRYSYGLRIPFTDLQFMAETAQRGDVAVFDYPEDRSKDYVKRIVGIPGDIITYKHNKLFINGEVMPLEYGEERVYFMADGLMDVSVRYEEELAGIKHDVLRKRYSIRDGQWAVPENMFFALGDNRNNSRDSRFWGFIPQEYLVGKAAFIWWSWDGHTNHIRWNRLGKIIY